MKPGNLLLAVTAVIFTLGAGNAPKTYRWVDENGVVHFGDSVPPQYADQEKQIVNEQGVHVGVVRGKKTAEELAEEARQAELERQLELERRADQALLATYLSVAEIEMHRDRRIELLRAQTKVTDLYLENLNRRMGWLEADASKYRPYSEDPEAPAVPTELVDDLQDTRRRIERYKALKQDNDQRAEAIAARFEEDIVRFRELKDDT